MKMKILLGICFLTVVSNFVFAQKITSVYTKLDSKSCQTLESNPNEGGSYRGRCAGIAGYKLDVLEGDIRQTINVITAKNKTFELNFWYFLNSFSSVGEKAEWRMKGKTPIGLIIRYNVSDPENSEKNISYLMVSKISKNEICVTDVIKPGKTQNLEARKVADTAVSKPCKPTE